MKFSPASTMLCNSGKAEAEGELSPEPLLNAFENFRGSFFDLNHNRQTTAADLQRIRASLLAAIRREGVAAGDRVLVALQNGPMLAAMLAACLEAGACPVLVHGDTPASELERMASKWGIQFVASEALQGQSKEDGIVSVDPYGEICWKRKSETVRDFTLRAVPLHPTSGTTGGPKIAVRPGPCAIAEPRHYIETLSIDSSDTILCALPMSHAYAYGMCLLVALLTSAKLVFMRRFSPELVHCALNELGISIFPAVPLMLDSLVAMNRELPAPRIVLSAGAPLQRKTFEDFRKHFGVPVRALYGTTETGGISIGAAEEEFSGSVGIPMRGVEVDLQPLGTNNDLKIVRVRSSSMMAGYIERDNVNREALHEGWFKTGDFARFDDRGGIVLQGRMSEVINVFGNKVVPQEVEEVILGLPGICEVKVFAARHLGPETVHAAVVCRGNLTEEQIIKHCEKHLVDYKCPTAVQFMTALPRTASGKVDLERLGNAVGQRAE